jgi:SAM-dependent methyltransferase
LLASEDRRYNPINHAPSTRDWRSLSVKLPFVRKAIVETSSPQAMPAEVVPHVTPLPPVFTAPLALNKPCEAEDFRNTTLLDVMRRVHSQAATGTDWPFGVEQRKAWEVAMAVLTLERYGKLNPEAEILGVGAGLEITTFYLTNFVRRVFATDLYADTASIWAGVAPPVMLTDPASISPIPCNPRRLVVQHMDGRNLLYEDNTFDGVYSSSSIEHFGDWEDVSKAAQEIGRVLKPGGILTLSTEYKIKGTGRGMPNVLVFSMEELRQIIIEPSGLLPVDAPSSAISPLTLQTVVTQQEMDEFYAEYNAGRPAQWKTFPQIVLESGEYSWTSYHLALQKPG